MQPELPEHQMPFTWLRGGARSQVSTQTSGSWPPLARQKRRHLYAYRPLRWLQGCPKIAKNGEKMVENAGVRFHFARFRTCLPSETGGRGGDQGDQRPEIPALKPGVRIWTSRASKPRGGCACSLEALLGHLVFIIQISVCPIASGS